MDLTLNFWELRALWTSRAENLASGIWHRSRMVFSPPGIAGGQIEKCLPCLRAPGLGVEQTLTEHLPGPKEGCKCEAHTLPFEGVSRLRYADRYLEQ